MFGGGLQVAIVTGLFDSHEAGPTHTWTKLKQTRLPRAHCQHHREQLGGFWYVDCRGCKNCLLL